MTTEGREKVEAAVYKERTTTRDERILTHDESGQDTSNNNRSGPVMTGYCRLVIILNLELTEDRTAVTVSTS